MLNFWLYVFLIFSSSFSPTFFCRLPFFSRSMKNASKYVWVYLCVRDFLRSFLKFFISTPAPGTFEVWNLNHLPKAKFVPSWWRKLSVFLQIKWYLSNHISWWCNLVQHSKAFLMARIEGTWKRVFEGFRREKISFNLCSDIWYLNFSIEKWTDAIFWCCLSFFMQYINPKKVMIKIGSCYWDEKILNYAMKKVFRVLQIFSLW